MDTDLSFLERYHDNAIKHFVPRQLQKHVRARLAQYGIQPMSYDDEQKLRRVAETFWPEKFDPVRAGLKTPKKSVI